MNRPSERVDFYVVQDYATAVCRAMALRFVAEPSATNWNTALEAMLVHQAVRNLSRNGMSGWAALRAELQTNPDRATWPALIVKAIYNSTISEALPK